MKRVDIIVCSRNNADVIGRCMESIRNQTFRGFNCILADDASSDGTPDVVRKEFPWVRIIQSKIQAGPAINRNIAIRRTNSEFIATIDSDVRLDKDWLKEQVAFMEDKKIGIAASKIFYLRNIKKLNSCGGGMSKLGFGFNRHCGKFDHDCKAQRVVYGHSAAMLVRREMLKEIGLFDGKYFYGNEDTDLGWRANLSGWDVVFNPRALAYHDENYTVRSMKPVVAFHATKNRMRSMIKNYSILNLIKYLPLQIIMSFGKALVSRNGSFRIKGILWNATEIGEILEARRAVQSTRKVEDDVLLELFAASAG